MVRQVKAAQTAAVACHDGEQCHAFEAVRENIGRHLRDGQQGDDQHDAQHAQAGHNGQCIRYSTMVTGRRCERANSVSKAMETSGRRKNVKAAVAMSANVPNK